jgi:hypothetical protein
LAAAGKECDVSARAGARDRQRHEGGASRRRAAPRLLAPGAPAPFHTAGGAGRPGWMGGGYVRMLREREGDRKAVRVAVGGVSAGGAGGESTPT